MKITSTRKRRYYKLDDIGLIGTQEQRSAEQIELDAERTARAIKKTKSSRARRPAKVT
jgi:hypothetical protein